MDFRFDPNAGSRSLALFTGGPPVEREIREHWWFAALVPGAWNVATARSLFSLSFKLRPNIPLILKGTIIPFSISAVRPGLFHFTLDVAAYAGSHYAFKALPEWYEQAKAWLQSVDRESLLSALGPERFNELTRGGELEDVVGVFQMPAVWLADP